MNLPHGSASLPYSGTAANMVHAAIAVATGKGNLSSTTETVTLLRRGNAALAEAFRHEIARQVAAALLMLDQDVLEVYQEHPQMQRSAEADLLEQPIKLWVLARHRSPTLYAGIDELNAALLGAYASVCDGPPPGLLQAIVVDSRDGYLLRGSAFWHGAEPVLLAARSTAEPTPLQDAAS